MIPVVKFGDGIRRLSNETIKIPELFKTMVNQTL